MTKRMDNTVGLFKRHRKLGWFCLLAAMAAICITLWSRDDGETRPPQIPKPIAFSVSFLGYSNCPSGQRWAILTVTNRDFGNLYFANPMSLEFAARPEDEQETHYAETHWKTSGVIPPGSCGRIAVEIPPVPGDWRMRCIISRYTWRDDVRDALPRWWPDFLLPRRTQIMDGLVTDWVRE
jgi:hypothetical protein